MVYKIISHILFSKLILLIGFIFHFTSIALTQNNAHQIENKDFYAVDCNTDFLNKHADTVIYYSVENRNQLCVNQKNYSAYVYYFGPNGILMYGAQDHGETVSYLKGKYSVYADNVLLIYEGEDEFIFHYWFENENLYLSPFSKKEKRKWRKIQK